MKNFLKPIGVILTFAFLQFYPLGTVDAASDVRVYICVTGKVYHSTKSCKGLRNATHEIKSVPLSQVENLRRPCKICY